MSNEAAGGESRVKIIASITRMAQPHPPHPSSALSADIYKPRGSHRSPKTAGEEGLKEGWRCRAHLSTSSTKPVPPCSLSHALRAAWGRLCWELQVQPWPLAPILPSREGTLLGMLQHWKQNPSASPAQVQLPTGAECAAPHCAGCVPQKDVFSLPGCHSEGSHAQVQAPPHLQASALCSFMAPWTNSCLKFFLPPFLLIKEKEDADSASGHPGFQSTAGGQKGKSPIKLFTILMSSYKKGSSHNQPYLLQAVILPGWQDDLLDTALVAYECIWATVKINEGGFGVSPLQTLSVLVLAWWGESVQNMQMLSLMGKNVRVIGLKEWQTCNF